MLDYQKGDLITIAHTIKTSTSYRQEYSDPLEVVKVSKNKKTGQIRLSLEDGSHRLASEVGLCHYPSPGDKVVICAGTYEAWYCERLKTFKYEMDDRGQKRYERGHWEFVNGGDGRSPHDPDKFPWSAVFQIRQTLQDQALIVCSGYRYRLPINCLQVLQPARIRRHEQQSA